MAWTRGHAGHRSMQQKVAAAGAECRQGMPRLVGAVQHSRQGDVGELGLAGLDQGVEPGRSGGTGGAGNAQHGQGAAEAGGGFERGAQVADAVDEDRGRDCGGVEWMLGQCAARRFVLDHGTVGATLPYIEGCEELERPSADRCTG